MVMDALRRLPAQAREITPSFLLTYLLFCVFGVGSWVAINGIWGELSVLVVSLPECYNLPAILAVIIQVANVGPIVYVALKFLLTHYSVKIITIEIIAVYVIVGVGLVSCVVLSLVWDKTAVLGGQRHSVALIVLTFFLGLVDCTSTLVFIPFLKHFPAVYVSALYIGEGMSGVLPSVAALSQGFVNDSLDCTDSYVGIAELGINFSPNVYFLFLASLTVFCGLAFTAIITIPAVRRQMIPTSLSMLNKSPFNSPTHSNISKVTEDSSKAFEEEVTESREVRERITNSPTLMDSDSAPLLDSSGDKTGAVAGQPPNYPPAILNSHLGRLLLIAWNNLVLFVCMFIINFTSNGALPAISAFVFKPYGNTVYNVAINLGILAGPIVTLFYAILSHKSRTVVAVLTAVMCLLAIYLLMMAVLSPEPLLKHHVAGRITIVSGTHSLCVALWQEHCLHPTYNVYHIVHVHVCATACPTAPFQKCISYLVP